MSFVSNVDHLALGEGVYNNIHGNMNVYPTLAYGRKRLYDFESDQRVLLAGKRRRRTEDEDGIKIIRRNHLKLSLEIGSGPGYFLHVGETKGRAVIVKVFNHGPTSREPIGTWKTAEGQLAAALKDGHTRPITLGFKMIAGLSSGMNHLIVQGISPGSLGVDHFDVFLDANDRFLISMNPPRLTYAHTPSKQQPAAEDSTSSAWIILNLLCQKVLRSTNRVLHNEDIERTPATPDMPALESHSYSKTLEAQKNVASKGSAPPRREYVWRIVDRGQQSLAAIAAQITRDLDMEISSSVRKFAWSDWRSAHRCAGYVREEITLAAKTGDSAVIFHDVPSPQEICSVCHEVVGIQEVFRCSCGDQNPGSRATIKCQICQSWSHRDCTWMTADFVCESCTAPLPQYSRLPLPSTPSTLRVGSEMPSLFVEIEEFIGIKDELLREINGWRKRSSLPPVEHLILPHESASQQLQSLQMVTASLRLEANEWRMRARVQADLSIARLPAFNQELDLSSLPSVATLQPNTARIHHAGFPWLHDTSPDVILTPAEATMQLLAGIDSAHRDQFMSMWTTAPPSLSAVNWSTSVHNWNGGASMIPQDLGLTPDELVPSSPRRPDVFLHSMDLDRSRDIVHPSSFIGSHLSAPAQLRNTMKPSTPRGGRKTVGHMRAPAVQLSPSDIWFEGGV
ncbi:hypothetical protein C8R47DRAFT_1328197 [Mycena vitilis]|nr:hypothetical protein C8R47DRAFT_1328197 [Mycena vitilis]